MKGSSTASPRYVPFYPQIWDLGAWRESGFASQEDAHYWQDSSCGVLCLKMAIEGFLATAIDPISRMIERGEGLGAYAHDTGWSHRGLVNLAQLYGVEARARNVLSEKRIKRLLDRGALIIVSIKWAFGSERSLKERILFWRRRGGHLALLVGYTDKGFIVHHTSITPGYNWEGAVVPFAEFKRGFTGRGIVLKRMFAKGKLHVRASFLWYDFWIGAYYDRDSKVLYICPLPMCVIKIWRA
ncbi:hypothetical protein COU19_02975 [Candidatus Kaiserbacteria bacterium CG10_big_fil_rev_8_21_14_0_10_56_12]|uniref:Peptidase C39-like domain-containing protein n=1 Tax=Candidatus Kaiserbacteria bacterium CG10_big_fil_rev_8_21_14_0_10_56_12 TaxID=1974611 RepID=A0A2H0U9B1_9BACT|nr:MAG: hypothetical protein COU19_02975 [Candidatus Kaiserbacteria bacterium CG10_big_fil_rev_8_21_14_0_10_56_12]